MQEPGLISVRTEVVLDTLVGSIADAVKARLDEPLAAPVEAALRALGEDGMARAGYLARAAEVARFERARAPMPWLADAVERAAGDWSARAVAVASELAEREPEDRPAPDDERAVTWRVPGPGGHVRHYVALSAAGAAMPRAELKRRWVAGFLVHCVAETVAPR